jgi:hypothetical protein
MNHKFQEIIETPAVVVPAMSTEEIRNTLFEASVEYIKQNLPLETLVLIATKIQYFMGMRLSSQPNSTPKCRTILILFFFIQLIHLGKLPLKTFSKFT